MAHRLEFVRDHGGVCWYNDSIATAPERTMAAIHSFDEPIVLLLGGRDKNLPWEDLAELVHERVDHVVLFGEAAGKIEQALGADKATPLPISQHRVATLREAVAEAARSGRSRAMWFCCPPAERASTSSRILKSEERNLDYGYRNFHNRSALCGR